MDELKIFLTINRHVRYYDLDVVSLNLFYLTINGLDFCKSESKVYKIVFKFLFLIPLFSTDIVDKLRICLETGHFFE